MKKVLILVIVASLVTAGILYWNGPSDEPQGEAIKPEVSLVNTSGASGIALSGFDPVAFFTEKKPVHGDPTITVNHVGAIYMFSTHENKKAFETSPETYTPQYGGFSSLGISFGSLLPVDISTWKVVDGKLYLDLNPEYAEEFHADFEENVTSADEQWPQLVEKNLGLDN